MSSLTSPGLVKATNEALVKIAPELNYISMFSFDASDAVADYGLTVKVPVINAAASALSDFNASSNDYENASGTVTYASISLNKQPVATFEFAGKDLLEAPNSPYWSRCAESAARVIRGSISDTIGGLFLSTAISTSVTFNTDISALTLGDFVNLRTNCAGRVGSTVLGLSPAYYNGLLTMLQTGVYGNADAMRSGIIENLFGFKGVVQLTNLPDGINGALIPENGLIFASRAVAVGDESCYSEIGTATDENGFTLTTLRHGSAAKGTGFINVTCLYGATLVPATGIKLLK